MRHRQANMVEWIHRELARFFRTFLPVDGHNSWYNYVEKIETILNKSHHDTIEITPHESLKGEYIIRMVRWNIRTKGEKRATRLNKDKTGITFEVGEQVLVKACNVANMTAGRVAKFLALSEVPYAVKKRITQNTYILTNTNTQRERGQIHAIDLKHYYTSNGPGVGGGDTWAREWKWGWTDSASTKRRTRKATLE